MRQPNPHFTGETGEFSRLTVSDKFHKRSLNRRPLAPRAGHTLRFGEQLIVQFHHHAWHESYTS
jgi:hypothetical protein